MVRVAINGFGRIGRLVFRIMEEDENFEVVAINDLTDASQLAYLLKYDTNHRNYRCDEISSDSENLIVGNRKIRVFAQSDPSTLPWGDLDIDVVFECTGFFTEKDKAMAHINAGAKKVIISAPAKGDLKTIVYNVNDNILDGSEQIISAASCTTNCLAPVLNVIENEFGIVKGYMTTVHAYTNDHASTGAASAIGKVIPSLEGKMQGTAMRVPVTTGSVVDLVLELKRNTSVDEINSVLKNSVNETLGYTEDPIVSSDIIGNHFGGVVDSLLTSVNEVDGKQLVKIVAWYDNEMGYSAQMVRTAKKLMTK